MGDGGKPRRSPGAARSIRMRNPLAPRLAFLLALAASGPTSTQADEVFLSFWDGTLAAFDSETWEARFEIPASSGAMALDRSRQWLYLAGADRSIWVISIADGSVKARIGLEHNAAEVLPGPDEGTALAIVASAPSRVVVVDAVAERVTKSIDAGSVVSAWGAQTGAVSGTNVFVGNRAIVAERRPCGFVPEVLFCDIPITIVDLNTSKVRRREIVGDLMGGMAVAGSRLFVAHVVPPGSAAIGVIDLETDSLIRRFTLEENRDFGSYPAQLTTSRAGDTLWVGNKASQKLFRVDTATHEIKAEAKFEHLGNFAISSDETHIYSITKGGLLKLDAQSLSIVESISLGRDSVRVLIDRPVISPTNTATPTLSPPSSPTASPTPLPCWGDCSMDGEVTVDEIVSLISISLGLREPSSCPQGDRNADGEITVDEIVGGIHTSLVGCD